MLSTKDNRRKKQTEIVRKACSLNVDIDIYNVIGYNSKQ